MEGEDTCLADSKVTDVGPPLGPGLLDFCLCDRQHRG